MTEPFFILKIFETILVSGLALYCLEATIKRHPAGGLYIFTFLQLLHFFDCLSHSIHTWQRGLQICFNLSANPTNSSYHFAGLTLKGLRLYLKFEKD